MIKNYRLTFVPFFKIKSKISSLLSYVSYYMVLMQNYAYFEEM